MSDAIRLNPTRDPSASIPPVQQPSAAPVQDNVPSASLPILPRAHRTRALPAGVERRPTALPSDSRSARPRGQPDRRNPASTSPSSRPRTVQPSDARAPELVPPPSFPRAVVRDRVRDSGVKPAPKPAVRPKVRFDISIPQPATSPSQPRPVPSSDRERPAPMVPVKLPRALVPADTGRPKIRIPRAVLPNETRRIPRAVLPAEGETSTPRIPRPRVVLPRTPPPSVPSISSPDPVRRAHLTPSEYRKALHALNEAKLAQFKAISKCESQRTRIHYLEAQFEGAQASCNNLDMKAHSSSQAKAAKQNLDSAGKLLFESRMELQARERACEEASIQLEDAKRAFDLNQPNPLAPEEMECMFTQQSLNMAALRVKRIATRLNWAGKIQNKAASSLVELEELAALLEAVKGVEHPLTRKAKRDVQAMENFNFKMQRNFS